MIVKLNMTATHCNKSRYTMFENNYDAFFFKKKNLWSLSCSYYAAHNSINQNYDGILTVNYKIFYSLLSYFYYIYLYFKLSQMCVLCIFRIAKFSACKAYQQMKSVRGVKDFIADSNETSKCQHNNLKSHRYMLMCRKLR